jgi:hypothetical protein
VTKPIFLLGVGAQKAGTTWLHEYLASLPEVDLGFMKEYHVFDQNHVLDTTPGRKKRFENYLDSFFGSDSLSIRHKFRRNHKHYFSYFRKLVDSPDQVFITGDITPSYAALPVKVLRYIKSSLEKNGFRVRVVFLMRDPVARCISANRMYSSPRLLDSPGDAALEAELLAKKYQQTRFQIRTRYDQTINNLEQVFTSDELYLGFYEELFSDKAIAEICSFLELPFRPGKYEQVVHGSLVKSELPETIKSEVRSYYSQVYDFVLNRFGQDRVKKLWKMK